MDSIPNDENGAVLRRMRDGGDSLQKARFVEYCFTFPSRELSIDFARTIPEKDFEVSLSYYEEREIWQAIVKKFMAPQHKMIGDVEAELTRRAALCEGEADGWGCIRITELKTSLTKR